MRGISDTPFADVGKIPAEVIYSHAKRTFLEVGGGDCIYLLGAGWDCLPALDPLERDLGVVAITNVNSDVWAMQKRLHLREPVKGYGRLLEEMP